VCGRCGVTRRGSRAAPSQPITQCLDCLTPLCAKHATWVGERVGYLCRKCLKEAP
jgi:hypothetical protein